LIATSWADGDKLEWGGFSPPLPIRKNILKTIAEVALDLLKMQEPGQMIRGLPGSLFLVLGGSAVEWIINKTHRT
jgi:hypothetical protein